MATNITNLIPRLNTIDSSILSFKISGVTDRSSRLRFTISSQNNTATSISGQVIIDTNVALDGNNQRPWEKEFSLDDDDFFVGDLNCGDTLDINIEWLDGTNGWVQEDNFPAQMPMDCTAPQGCAITIEPIMVGVRPDPTTDSNLLSLKISGTANLCTSVRIAVTADNNATYHKTVAVINNSWEVKFDRGDSSGFNGKYFTCGQLYTVVAICEDDTACSTTQRVEIHCINPCSRFASLILTRLADNVQLSDPGILHCMPPGNYTIAVTDPPAAEVLDYEWYKDDVLIPNETGRSIQITLSNQEESAYTVFAITESGCTLQQEVTFACGEGKRDCVVSDWSDWGPCIDDIQTRTMTIITPAANGGAPCPPDMIETRDCDDKDPVTCVVSDWIPGRCVNNRRTDTRTILVQPQNGAPACPELTRTVRCRTRETESDIPTLSCLMFKILALLGLGFIFLGTIMVLCPALTLPIPPPVGVNIAIGLLVLGGILLALGLTLWIILCSPTACDWLALAWQSLILLAFLLIYAGGCPLCLWMLWGVLLLIAGAALMIVWGKNCNVSRCHVLVELVSLFTFVINIVAVLEIILAGCVLASNPIATIAWGAMIAVIQAWLWFDMNRSNCIRL